MSQNATNKLPDTFNKKSKIGLEDLLNNYTKKHGPPDESYDGTKNTLFGWTEDGQGVWILPATKANFERFEDIARSRPDLGHDMHSHCEIMRLAGAEFFADWRDSDRARALQKAEPGQ